MFWKVPGFSQILDKEEFTLEELLDEDDMIQECKSLNSRLVAFLRERTVVDQLVRYMIEPQDSDDPKKTYKYPFTACEVLCCKLEVVYNTMLEDAELMQLLFSLLSSHAPLSCKTAGYFGRTVSSLLSRKGPEMFEFFKEQGDSLLEKLVEHVGTTSIADVIKRMLHADDQNGMLPLPEMTAWLAESPLISLLLARLASSYEPEVQANAADILCAVAHTQPSPPASRLAAQPCITALMEHALAPGRAVLVPALDVCIALLEPHRVQAMSTDGGMAPDPLPPPPPSADTQSCRDEAVAAIVPHLPALVRLLDTPSSSEPLPMPAGQLAPPLGRHRLKVVELLAVLVRSSSPATEAAVLSCGALPVCLRLFADYPFNNLMHHHVAAMLVACASSASDEMLEHVFGACGLLEWLAGLPADVSLPPNVGCDCGGAPPALRAGYLGHVTQIASALESLAQESDGEAVAGGSSGDGEGTPSESKVSKYMRESGSWRAWVEGTLRPRQDVENTTRWECGRPAAQHMGGIDSDGEEFGHNMELDQVPLYSRYSSADNDDDDDDGGGGEDEDDEGGSGAGGAQAPGFGAGGLSDAMSGLGLGATVHGDPWGDDDEGVGDMPITRLTASVNTSAMSRGMDEDEVLLASSDEESAGEASSPEARRPGSGAEAEATGVQGGGGAGSAEPPAGSGDDGDSADTGTAGAEGGICVHAKGDADAAAAVGEDKGKASPGKLPPPSSWPIDVPSEVPANEGDGDVE